ncbi:unnamed protein product [Brassica oleracea]
MESETYILYGGNETSGENVTDLKPQAPFRHGRHAWDQNCGRQIVVASVVELSETRERKHDEAAGELCCLSSQTVSSIPTELYRNPFHKSSRLLLVVVVMLGIRVLAAGIVVTEVTDRREILITSTNGECF